MSETLFCYVCRTHHPKSEMRRFLTRTGYRWRCARTIEAAHKPACERDSFGRQQSAINREASRYQAEAMNRLRADRTVVL